MGIEGRPSCIDYHLQPATARALSFILHPPSFHLPALAAAANKLTLLRTARALSQHNAKSKETVKPNQNQSVHHRSLCKVPVHHDHYTLTSLANGKSCVLIICTYSRRLVSECSSPCSHLFHFAASSLSLSLPHRLTVGQSKSQRCKNMRRAATAASAYIQTNKQSEHRRVK